MCGRFSLSKRELVEITGYLDAVVSDEDAALYRPRWNIAPTDQHWIVRVRDGRRELAPATWGLRDGAELVINARSETVAEKRMFQEAFARRRCVIPADGFFEWTGPKSRRQPIWFHPPGGELLLLAGLYEPDVERPKFTILTTEANELVAPVHDRMPVVLAPGCVGEWLAAARLDLLKPAAAGHLVGTPASMRLNSIANDDPACLDPTNDPPEKQLRLF
jgi:putative SOS response-associated peptidase YedK